MIITWWSHDQHTQSKVTLLWSMRFAPTCIDWCEKISYQFHCLQIWLPHPSFTLPSHHLPTPPHTTCHTTTRPTLTPSPSYLPHHTHMDLSWALRLYHCLLTPRRHWYLMGQQWWVFQPLHRRRQRTFIHGMSSWYVASALQLQYLYIRSWLYTFQVHKQVQVYAHIYHKCISAGQNVCCLLVQKFICELFNSTNILSKYCKIINGCPAPPTMPLASMTLCNGWRYKYGLYTLYYRH